MSRLRFVRTMSISRAFFSAAMLATLVSPAAGARPVACPPGRFLLPEASLLVPGATPFGPPAVVIDGQQLGIDGCNPTLVKLKAKKKFTAVTATWPACGSLTKVKVTGKIAAPACTTFTGKRTAKKTRPARFTAQRSACGDRRLDDAGGEQCGDGGGCDVGEDCVDCRCEPGTNPILTTTTTTIRTATSTTATTTTVPATSTTTATTTTTRASTSSTSTTSTSNTTSTAATTTVTSTTTVSTTTTVATTTTVSSTTLASTTSTTVTTATTTTTTTVTATTVTSTTATTTTTVTTSTSTTSTTVPTATCRNGQEEGDEECDDGNEENTDACTNTCEDARCGDGFVWTGQEACDDGNGVPNDGCTNCTIDPPACGNGRIEAGETCDDGNTQNGDACPADCRVEPCTPTATRVDTTVRFARPTGTSVGGIVVYITYPDGRISLPGTGLETSVKARVTNPQTGFTINTNDFDYAIRVAESAANRTLNPANPLFRISYDLCQGQTAPAAAAFTCAVLDASTPLGDPLPLTGISCSVTVP